MTGSKPLQGVWRDVVRDSGVSWCAKLVGFTLSTFMNAAGRAFPSRATIAAGGSISVRSVDKGTVELEIAGLLEVKRTRGRSTHTYVAKVPPTAHEVHRSEWSNGAPQTANGAGGASNGARGAQESALKRNESVSLKKEKRRGLSGPATDLAYLDQAADDE